MSLLIHPTLTECRWCEWSIAVGSHAEKAKREAVHEKGCRYAPTAEAVAALVTGDPSHAADVETVEAAILLDANANSGEVDPNRVRQLIPPHVQPQVTSATYNRLIRQGVLSQVGWTTNTDRKGRNAGKPLPLYSYNFAARSA